MLAAARDGARAAVTSLTLAAVSCMVPSPAAAAGRPAVLRAAAIPIAIDGRLGLELGDPGRSALPIFADAMNAAAPWSAPGTLRIDSLGNVEGLQRGQVAQSAVCADGTCVAGDYELTYDGQGALGIDGATVLRRLPGRLVVRIAGKGTVRLALTATNPADYVRDLHLTPLGEAGAAPFVASTVAALQRVNVLRFAGPMRADRLTGTLDWSGRTATGAFTQSGPAGVAPEYLIALANATGDDPWFVFPAGVTDAYVAQFAQLVHATLDPRLHPIFEYGDAMWRAGSPGARYAALAGLASGLNLTSPAAATAWYAQRSGQVFALVTQAYGTDSVRIRRVLAGPPAVPGTGGAAVIRALLTSPAARLADAFAVTDVDGPGQSQAAARAAAAALAAQVGLPLWSEGRAAPVLGGGLAVTAMPTSPGAWAALADAVARVRTPHVIPLAAAWRTPVGRTIVVPAALGRAVRSAAAGGLVPGSDVIAISCGGQPNGNWVADTDYSTPSNAYTASGSITTAGVLDPAPQSVYLSERWNPGSLTYTIPGLTADTAYTVRLHWAETYVTGPGQRLFNVAINGAPVLTNFDVFATAGGQDAAVVENFYATANAAGQIVITFTGGATDPFISGIEIQVPGPIDAFDINAGGGATGNWLADTDFGGGASYAESSEPVATTNVSNPAPQAVYQSNRFSSTPLTYTIAGLGINAAYQVRLHFAELTATAKGQRAFNVIINGKQVLTKFDIFARAGGAFNAIVPSFSANAGSSGTITIVLNPVVGAPQINGIELQAPPVVDAAAIGAGGGSGGVWVPDSDAPTLLASTTATIATAGVSSPAPQAVYQTQRFMNAGPLVYQVPGLTPNGSYAVRMHFAELTATAPGQRVFNVTINSTQVLTNFDIFAQTGAQNTAVVETFNATANSQGHITIGLNPVVGNPAINGIEVVANAAPAPKPRVTPTPAALCIGGSAYTPTQDDEFSHDKTVKYAPDYIQATPQPNGAIWSSRAWDFESDGSRNNIGLDDAYYTDPTRGLGPYSPYSLGNGGLTITAVPVPAPYQSAPQLEGAHWLSGLLESATQTYGYVEVSAAVPNLQGQFSAPLWLLGPFGSDGLGNGYEEIDVNEMFGLDAPINVLFATENTTGPTPGSQQVVYHVPTEVERNSGTSFHTYGVLWTPSVVRFFVDRQPTGPDFPNGAFGPMHAIINLAVFAPNTWSPSPPNDDPETMSLQYYRWYQTTGSSCSPSQLPS